MVVKVSLTSLRSQLGGYRKSLVKRRRNLLAQAAKARRDGGSYSPLEREAKMTLEDIRDTDAKIGLIGKALNQGSWQLEVDLRDPGLRELGFGMDENGNYPAL
jgi:hypothetical protein